MQSMKFFSFSLYFFWVVSGYHFSNIYLIFIVNIQANNENTTLKIYYANTLVQTLLNQNRNCSPLKKEKKWEYKKSISSRGSGNSNNNNKIKLYTQWFSHTQKGNPKTCDVQAINSKIVYFVYACMRYEECENGVYWVATHLQIYTMIL